MEQAKFIEVNAGVRYWDDGTLNGESDVDGKMPCKKGSMWCPIIELATGKIQNWVQGNEAKIHYKVCDSGFYWLLNENNERIRKWKGYYVPNDFLCIGSNGYGDYIIFNVDVGGRIINWRVPYVDEEEWIVEEY